MTELKVEKIEQEKLNSRVAEIEAMSNKQLVWALCAEAGWEYVARRDMKLELANNTEKDLELLKYEILGRMLYDP
jgi:hypothetical protein